MGIPAKRCLEAGMERGEIAERSKQVDLRWGRCAVSVAVLSVSL